MSYILGLDLGTNSIGWACINPEEKKVIALGVRIFHEGVNRDTKGKEISRNATRRSARQSRRQYARKRQRKALLIDFLRRNEMYPQTKKEEDSFFKLNPYELRKRGLDEKISKFELGRILFHLNQRRGFKSSLKSGKEKENGKVKEATTLLQKEIEENNCRTLGEYLAGLKPMETRIRKRYTLRKMYEEEFDLLWENQKKHYSEFTETLRKELKEKIIFFQRPLKSVAALIGKCSLEPGKKRARKDSFEGQRYRILEQVNRLSFIDDDGVIQAFSRKPDEEFGPEILEKRNKLIDQLNKKKELKFDEIRNLLDLSKNTIFNLEKGGEKRILGNRTGAEYVKVFGKGWHAFPQEKKDKIHQVVTQAEDADWLEHYAVSKWDLAPEKAEKLAGKISFESGYLHLSKKAIRKLIPFLEDGLSLADAKEKAGYSVREEQQNPEELIQDLRNPIVQQTLYELLRLLRVIEQTYGKPGKVRVELARELKSSAEKRNHIRWENLDRQKANEEIRKKLEELQISPTFDSVQKY
ncbi:MAG: type II CRISPR RNA-guided endonuclease Cas9, partial [Nitrospinota bacterium]